MPTIKTLIIDDDNHMIETLTQLLSFFNYIDIKETCNNFLTAKKTLNSQQIDLVFLDIVLQNENGIEVAELIQRKFPNTHVVFITSQPEFALESYKAYPLDFLTKPINPIRLENTLIKVKDKIKKEKTFNIDDVRISVKIGSSIQLIEIKEIVLIQKKLRKIKIHLSDGSTLSCNETLKALENKLYPYGFVALSRTVLVPIQNILEINYDKYAKKYSVMLKNQMSIDEISQEKYRVLKQSLKEFNWII
ncbi:MAG: LytTR family DNA-binding domain-containing protein [Bacteroidales bacterium]|jgi:DNA-binding LytR/AlgR family response regulator|nr:LytTR family DNA-binding domain-containing protein [Bacteroidales bacterium]